MLFKRCNENILGVASDDSFGVDALVGLIEADALENECSIDVTVNLTNDDDQYFAYESVVVLHTCPLDHFHVLYLCA